MTKKEWRRQKRKRHKKRNHRTFIDNTLKLWMTRKSHRPVLKHTKKLRKRRQKRNRWRQINAWTAKGKTKVWVKISLVRRYIGPITQLLLAQNQQLVEVVKDKNTDKGHLKKKVTRIVRLQGPAHRHTM